MPSALQAPTSQATEYSPYEKETISRTLEATGLKIDRAPEGKIVDRVDIVRLEVLEDRDPIPENIPLPTLSLPVGAIARPGKPTIPARKILNALHYTSRDFVIRREMLVREGDPWVQVLVDETARNMRNRMPLQVSVVILLPVKSAREGHVSLLVITKDIWSLRLSFDLSVTPGGLESFVLVPQETNLLGWHHTLRTSYVYSPVTDSFGAGYTVPRFGKSWIGASGGATVTVNRGTGLAEGAAGSLNVGQGLYSTRTEWAWGVDGDVSSGVGRRFVNARVARFKDPTAPEDEPAILNEYRARSASIAASVTRSFGWAIKNNFSLSFNAITTSYETFDLSASPGSRDLFIRRIVPRGETRVYPALSWATFSTNYLRTLDINTLALQEDVQLGHSASIRVYPVAKAFGSTRDILGASGSLGYRVKLGDGFAAASGSVSAERSGDEITDGSVGGSFSIATPRLGIGRFVMDALITHRYANYLRGRTTAGGDDRLRGYPSNFFFGKDAIFYNIEFRSTSLQIFKLALGGVLFYDVGDAAQGLDQLRPKQSVGFGLRALIPQLNRAVFRADLAFPMNRGPFPETGITTPVDPVGFFFSFNQAFSP